MLASEAPGMSTKALADNTVFLIYADPLPLELLSIPLRVWHAHSAKIHVNHSSQESEVLGLKPFTQHVAGLHHPHNFLI